MALMRLWSPLHFGQQVRLMLRTLRRTRRITTAQALEEHLLFTSPLHSDISQGQIRELILRSDNRWSLEIADPSLTGVYGALPSTYTEWLLDRHNHFGDKSAKAFIDIFNHRLCCLTYLAWQKSRGYVETEQESSSSLTRLLAGSFHSSKPSSVGFHGLLHSARKPVVQMEYFLQRRLGHAVCIKSFTGAGAVMPLPLRAKISSQRLTLGEGPAIGQRQRTRCEHFTVVLGPVSREEATSFYQHADKTSKLISLIRDYAGPMLRFSISLLIQYDHIRPARLGNTMLGLHSWLGKCDTGITKTLQLYSDEENNNE